jgi:uncharacterized protein (DUF2141 family)
MKALISILFLCSLHTLTVAQSLVIRVSGFRNQQGNVQLQFFDTAEHFNQLKPLLTKTVPKSAIVNGELSFTCTGLKPGIYGVAALDDENSNTKMDYGLLMPKEGFGFSDYYHTSLMRPGFKKFKFLLGSEPKTVMVKLRYL